MGGCLSLKFCFILHYTKLDKKVRSKIMSEKNRTGLFIMIGLIFIGVAARSSISILKSYDRVVNVKGLAEMEVEANQVIWPIVYKEIGNDLSHLHNVINLKNRKIVAYLISKGLDESEISISAPQIIDMKAERYSSDQKQYRYNITGVITVTSNKVALVREIISGQSELLAEGIAVVSGDYQFQTQYNYTLLNEVKPIMIEEATKNARATAEKFAIDSNSKLGKIKYANQGQFSIYDRDQSTPHIKKIRVVSTIEYLLRD